MHKPAPQELLYDPMPRPDVKLPPIKEPKSLREDSKRLLGPDEKAEVKDLLSNLTFS
jgi:hypothetical protein